MRGVVGKPIRVCPSHVTSLGCGCRGVTLDDVAELNAVTHAGCAVCQMPPRRTRPNFRILRKCHRAHCYGCFRVSVYDDVYVDERFAILKRRLRRITKLWR